MCKHHKQTGFVWLYFFLMEAHTYILALFNKQLSCKCESVVNLGVAVSQVWVDVSPGVDRGQVESLPGSVVVRQTMVSSTHDGLYNEVLARILQWTIVSTCNQCSCFLQV